MKFQCRVRSSSLGAGSPQGVQQRESGGESDLSCAYLSPSNVLLGGSAKACDSYAVKLDTENVIGPD